MLRHDVQACQLPTALIQSLPGGSSPDTAYKKEMAIYVYTLNDMRCIYQMPSLTSTWHAHLSLCMSGNPHTYAHEHTRARTCLLTTVAYHATSAQQPGPYLEAKYMGYSQLLTASTMPG